MDYIETSVFVEIITDEPISQRSKEKCRSCVVRALRDQSGCIGIFSLTELHKVVLEKVPADYKRMWVIETIDEWAKNLPIVAPRWSILEILPKLRQIDYNLELLDALHFASAISGGAQRFITLEERYLTNEKFRTEIRKEFGLDIVTA